MGAMYVFFVHKKFSIINKYLNNSKKKKNSVSFLKQKKR